MSEPNLGFEALSIIIQLEIFPNRFCFAKSGKDKPERGASFTVHERDGEELKFHVWDNILEFCDLRLVCKSFSTMWTAKNIFQLYASAQSYMPRAALKSQFEMTPAEMGGIPWPESYALGYDYVQTKFVADRAFGPGFKERMHQRWLRTKAYNEAAAFVLPCGEHQGKQLKDVPVDYVIWLSGKHIHKGVAVTNEHTGEDVWANEAMPHAAALLHKRCWKCLEKKFTFFTGCRDGSNDFYHSKCCYK